MNAAEKIKSLLPRIGNEIHPSTEQLIDAIGEVIDNNRYFVAAPARAEGTTVLEFEIPVFDAITNSQRRFWINMPHGARVLNVEGGHLWALVDPGAITVSREFYCIGGALDEVLPGSKYIGSVVVGTASEGPLLWHIFEEGKL